MSIHVKRKGFVLFLFCASLLFAQSPANYEDIIFLFNNFRLPSPFADALKKEVEEAFPNVKVQCRFVKFDIKDAFHEQRKQYNADEIIKLSSKKFHKEITNKKFIVIVSEDLYSEGSDFVFGESDLGVNTAVISTCRLGKLGQAKFFQRTKIELFHELGHLFWLDHCADPRCIMFHSKTLEDTDKKTTFCPIHNPKLK